METFRVGLMPYVVTVASAFAFVGIILGLPAPPSSAAAELEEIELLVGSSTSILIPRGSTVDVVVGNPAILNVTPLVEQGSVALTGIAPGISSLSVWVDRERRLYRVRVYGTPPARLIAEVGRLLTGIEGVDVKRVGDRVFIDGAVGQEADLARVQQIADLYGGEVESLVRIDPSVVKLPMIALEFQLVELSENNGTALGLRWPTAINASGRVSAQVRRSDGGSDQSGDRTSFSIVASSTDLAVGLDLAVREGIAEVHNVSTVVTEVGRKAQYAVGGEFLVRTVGINGGGLERIQHGTRFEVEPRVDDERHIQLQINASVSYVDESRSVDGLPTLTTNDVSTAVNLDVGQTVILSGLDARSRARQEDGLWPFAHIPIIGYLFESRTDSEVSRRSVVFITPRLYRPDGDGIHDKVLTPLLDRWQGER